MDDLHGGHKRDICRMRRLGTLMVLGWDGDAFWDVPEAPVSIPLRSLPGSNMMLTDVVWTDLCVRRWDLGTTQLTGSGRCVPVRSSVPLRLRSGAWGARRPEAGRPL